MRLVTDRDRLAARRDAERACSSENLLAAARAYDVARAVTDLACYGRPVCLGARTKLARRLAADHLREERERREEREQREEVERFDEFTGPWG